MFQNEERRAAALINDVLDELGYGRRSFEMRAIPFSGTWGTSSSISYQLATEQLDQVIAAETVNLSKKEAKRRTQELVRQRAQEIASQVAGRLAGRYDFGTVEAVNGYINILFDTKRFSGEVIQSILDAGTAYGHGSGKTDWVMVEYSQPNTHKEFHVGHLRNVCLGNALTRILRLDGFDLLAANYIGDIGAHVIRTLWCYLRFHQGEEPSRERRGRWLGELYTEANQRLNYRQDVADFLDDLARDDAQLVAAVERETTQLRQEQQGPEGMVALIGRIARGREPDAEGLLTAGLLASFWQAIGEQLTHEARLANGRGDDALLLQKRLERWHLLEEHLDWWPCVPDWHREVRDTFQLWERKDLDFMRLWEETKTWSMEEFHRIYEELDVHFDVWFYESEMEDEGRAIVSELLERGIAEISDGLPVVKIDEKLGLKKETYRTLPILRSDGTTLYSTKDLALTKLKFEQYHVDRSIWVVDVRQSLYFQQIFKIMELWGFEQASKCFHLGYETVMLPTGAMSSRLGNVVLYEDLITAVLRRAREIIEEKNPTLPADLKERIARDVGIGSVKYSMLSRDNNRVFVFDIEEALSFDGHAAPYIQYAHARACRILEKVEVRPIGAIDFGQEPLSAEEINLVQQLAIFPAEVRRAAEEYKPLVIASYVYDVAKQFNDFYRSCPVLLADEPRRSARLALVDATRQVLANGLGLLGIAAPEIM
jgi:arginyl-tRNA synthetase